MYIYTPMDVLNHLQANLAHASSMMILSFLLNVEKQNEVGLGI